jgi:capsular polysaccharide biosynthesis protein
MQHFLLITTKHWKKILALTLLTAIASGICGFILAKTPWDGTTFINIGAKQNFQAQNGNSLLENVQASDAFSESVQGWFKNPSFINGVKELSGTSVDFSARKQEKQNIVVAFKASSEAEIKKISQVLEENLRIEIGKYNLATGADFQITLFDTTTSESKNHLAIFITLGLVLGLFFGFGICSIFETFSKEFQHFARK